MLHIIKFFNFKINIFSIIFSINISINIENIEKIYSCYFTIFLTSLIIEN